ncbi:MAG: zinc ribbon domain-containing protein [Gracilibacteraceae bacterium]|jgi:hypothetical protein|nr:zinc ribbon domain-containing protein [Gracilibacteraceae bacterium]
MAFCPECGVSLEEGAAFCTECGAAAEPPPAPWPADPANQPFRPQSILDYKPATEIFSVKDWIITYLITAIPVYGIVMLFIWAFGENPVPIRKNWARASLIVGLVSCGLSLIIGALLMSSR